MREIPLHGSRAVGRVALVDDEDFDLVMQYHWNVLERRGHARLHDIGPYAVTSIDYQGGRNTKLLMHRLLMPGLPRIDHRDGNGLNNQRRNLRPVTRGQNQSNSRPKKTGSSHFKGVCWTKGKWQAQIRAAGHTTYLGRFADEVAAARRYDEAAREAFGEFARLNFPEQDKISSEGET